MSGTSIASGSLEALGARATTPGYDRRDVQVGVVHLGVGGFHRAHQAVYLDRVMEATGDLRWGICGIGVLPGDRAMQEALDAQDGLYSVVEKHGDGTQEVRVVGSLVEYLLAPQDPEAAVERMAAETTRIVSLTITEGGYVVPREADESLDRPRSAFGLICAALRRRRERGLVPPTIMSCDNLEANGRLTRERLTAFAELHDPDLAAWMREEVRFPSSMVDRITPATTPEDRAELAERHGIEDRWPVVCEPFSQWVLEDDFPAGRPELERVGVQLVDDVEPYELMKLRLLNGSHQALAYLSYLAGHRLVHDAAQDPLLRAFVAGFMDEEVTPTLPPVPGIDLDDYKRTLLERFSNAGLRDTVARLAAYASDRIPPWVVPVVVRQLETGGEVRRCATVIAAWARYAEGVDEDGEPIEVVDLRREALAERARRWRAEPVAFLEDRELFGDLADHERFVAEFRAASASLREHGARRTLEAVVAGAARGGAAGTARG